MLFNVFLETTRIFSKIEAITFFEKPGTLYVLDNNFNLETNTQKRYRVAVIRLRVSYKGDNYCFVMNVRQKCMSKKFRFFLLKFNNGFML